MCAWVRAWCDAMFVSRSVFEEGSNSLVKDGCRMSHAQKSSRFTSQTLDSFHLGSL